jgi:hypothetical protein
MNGVKQRLSGVNQRLNPNRSSSSDIIKGGSLVKNLLRGYGT